MPSTGVSSCRASLLSKLVGEKLRHKCKGGCRRSEQSELERACLVNARTISSDCVSWRAHRSKRALRVLPGLAPVGPVGAPPPTTLEET